MPVDIFVDPLLRQKPPGFDKPVLASTPKTTRSTQLNDQKLLIAELQDFDLSEIQQDALCDFNIRKKLGQDTSQTLDVPGGRTSLVPDHDISGSAAAVFNNASLDRKIRLTLNDLLRVHHLTTIAPLFAKTSKWEWRTYPSDIFSSSTCVTHASEILPSLAEGFEDFLPFNAVCHTILHMPHGLWVLGRVLLAYPQRVPDLAAFLMHQCNGDDIQDASSIFYGKVLLYLGHVFPASALHIRYLAINQQKFFILTLSITLQFNKKQQSQLELDQDIVELLEQLIASPREDFRAWSSEKARLAAASGAASFEECRLQLLIHAYKLLPTTSLELTEAQVIPVMRIMRLYIHLKESAELTLTTEEHRTLSKLATCRTTGLSTLSNQFIVLGLCCFTLLPDLLVDRTVETDFVEWVKWMLEVDVAALDAMVPDGGTHLEVLLLITSHLRAGQYKNITEILSDCLGFKVSVKANATVRMKNLLNNEVFRDDALLRHTLRIPPTQNLNASLISALPVNCIHSLLQNKTTFTSCDTLIKDWILAQMRKCSTPVHPVMVQVLALYIERTLPFLKKNSDGVEEWFSLQKPFGAAEICSVLYEIWEPTKLEMKRLRTIDLFTRSADRDASVGLVHVSKILMAFYVLAFNNYYMNHLKTFMTAQSLNLQPYDMDLINKIPFKYYLAVAFRHQELYDPLGDILGRLMLEVLPQMRTVYDDMQSGFFEEETDKQPIFLTEVPGPTESMSRYLDNLSRAPVARLCSSLDDFISLLPRLGSESVPPSTQDAFEKVWNRLVAVDSNSMFFATTIAFLLLHDKSAMSVTPEDLSFEPLHILRCDSSLFRKGFLTRILLRIFTAHLTASKLYLSNQLEIVQQDLLMKRGYNESLDGVREDRKRAMFMLQESLAVQILIENCVTSSPSETAKMDFGLPEELTESQSAICTFIHRMVLTNPPLAKLVIFQGFPLAAVPVIVQGVESLHICFDYLHEAMDLPSLSKKLFILELTSCLCLKFRIARTLVVARLVVDVVGTILIAYPQGVRAEIITVGARCLARIGNVFPPLRDDCLAILDQMTAMDRSGKAASRQWRHTARSLISCTSHGNPVGLQALLSRAVTCVSGQQSLVSHSV